MRWEKNRKSVRGYHFVLSALVTLASWGIAYAETFNVTRLDDPTPDGCAPADCSLREAVIDANGNGEDDTILLPAGTYALALPTVGGDDPLGGSLDVTAGYRSKARAHERL